MAREQTSDLISKTTKLQGERYIFNYIIIRVHSRFSLVENCDLLEERRTLTPFQRQANHNNFRIIDSQWRALFCINSNHAKWRIKSFRRTTKLILAKFSHFYYIKQINNILPLSVQL